MAAPGWDERSTTAIQRWMFTPSAVPEGRCSDNRCWYTLPLVDGLIVDHSLAMGVEPCPGGGKPPRTASNRPVLVARCDNVTEPDGQPCPGELHFQWGAITAACTTCGGHCGISVARWTRVDEAPPRPSALTEGALP